MLVATGGFLLLASFMYSPKAVAFTGLGDGSSGDPYKISSCSQLVEIKDAPTANFELTADIDCSAIPAGASTFPIAMNAGGFQGTFDGQGHKIQGITINMPSINSIGLFYEPTNSAVIKNVSVYADITGSSNAGIIAGYAWPGTQFSRIDTHGSVTCVNNCGGIVGQLDSSTTLSRSWSDADVGGVGYTYGGLVGWGHEYGISISDVYFRGNVNPTGPNANYVGGIIGFADGVTITNAYTTGSVTGLHYVAGIIGFSLNAWVGNLFTAADIQGVGMGMIAGGAINLYALDPKYIDGGANGFTGDDGFGSVVIDNSNYFKQNSTSVVFNNWDFDNTWSIAYQDYPTLRPIAGPVFDCQAPSSTDTSISGECNVLPVGWGVLNWEARYQKQGDSGWTTVNLADNHLGQATVTGLKPGTWYTLQLRFSNDYVSSDWGPIQIMTTGTEFDPATTTTTVSSKTVSKSSSTNSDSSDQGSFLGDLVSGELGANTIVGASTKAPTASVAGIKMASSSPTKWWLGGFLIMFGLVYAFFRSAHSGSN